MTSPLLIEQKVDLDSYADLTEEKGEVEGITEFTPGKRPMVRIANALQAAYNGATMTANCTARTARP
jgi:hypothetical protein